jgi:hypothetical protein
MSPTRRDRAVPRCPVPALSELDNRLLDNAFGASESETHSDHGLDDGVGLVVVQTSPPRCGSLWADATGDLNIGLRQPDTRIIHGPRESEELRDRLDGGLSTDVECLQQTCQKVDGLRAPAPAERDVHAQL